MCILFYSKYEDSIDKSKKGRISCMVNEEEIGSLIYSPDQPWENNIQIEEIIVKRDLRKRGFGTKLIKKLKNICEEQYKSCPIYAYVTLIDDTTIEELIAFYIKNEFKVELEKMPDEYNAKFTFAAS